METNFVTAGKPLSITSFSSLSTDIRFAYLMPPYRETLMLLAAGRVEEALLYFARESSFLLIDEIQHCLKRTMPVSGDISLFIEPFEAIATGISRELATFVLKLIDERKLIIRPSFRWSGKLTPIVICDASVPSWETLKVAYRPSKGPKIRRVPTIFVAQPRSE